VDAGAKLSECDVCTKFITPALVAAGWGVRAQIHEEVSFTKDRIIVRGRLVTRGKAKRADYVLLLQASTAGADRSQGSVPHPPRTMQQTTMEF
jgi:type I site-specific restriction endonuclease